jgi:mRNA interferase MazF
VLSPQRYNDRVGLAVVCPITSRIKGYPFEVEMRDVAPIAGAILGDHVRSIRLARAASRTRRAHPAGCAR